MTVLSPPIPAYQNVPIEPQFYSPNQFFISAITLGVYTIITTSIDNNFVIGQEVRLLIPPSFGTRGLNGQTAFVVSLPASNQVTLAINSIGMDAFIASTNTTESAQILPVGDTNSGQINSSGRVNYSLNIPGSFINISPL